ncbi:hypothetical protein ACQKJG_18140 [Priestia megaterium]|uniref:hypothetical protein n=1 Tax=Priestia megaterium TaxID=1404 RepID=UPI003CFEEE1C
MASLTDHTLEEEMTTEELRRDRRDLILLVGMILNELPNKKIEIPEQSAVFIDRNKYAINRFNDPATQSVVFSLVDLERDVAYERK